MKHVTILVSSKAPEATKESEQSVALKTSPSATFLGVATGRLVARWLMSLVRVAGPETFPDALTGYQSTIKVGKHEGRQVVSI